jgi:hypothetical protein
MVKQKLELASKMQSRKRRPTHQTLQDIQNQEKLKIQYLEKLKICNLQEMIMLKYMVIKKVV